MSINIFSLTENKEWNAYCLRYAKAAVDSKQTSKQKKLGKDYFFSFGLPLAFSSSSHDFGLGKQAREQRKEATPKVNARVVFIQGARVFVAFTEWDRSLFL